MRSVMCTVIVSSGRQESFSNSWDINASRQGLRGDDTMRKRVWKSEEKEGMCDSPTYLTPIRCSNLERVASRFSMRLSDHHGGLTPAEMEIALFVFDVLNMSHSRS